MLKGKTVSILEHNQVLSGACLEDHGGRVHLLLTNGSERTLNEQRIVCASSESLDLTASRGALLKQLLEKSRLQDRLAEQVDVAGVWKSVGPSAGALELETLARKAFGDGAGSDHRAAVLKALLRDRVHFKMQAGGFTANSPERITALRAAIDRERENALQIKAAVTWLRSAISGNELCCEGRQDFVNMLKDFVAFGRDAPRFDIIREVLKRAGLPDQKACFDVLTKLGIWHADENFLLTRHRVPGGWPAGVRDQTRACAREASKGLFPSGPEREDLTGTAAFAIDDPFTRDVDDAISFETDGDALTLGIHITDVAGCIPPGSPLDRAALQRGTTLYLPEGKLPMLPPEISEGVLSLKEREPRRALSFIVRLNPEGRILNCRTALSVVRVERRLSYKAADADIAEGGLFAAAHRMAGHLRRNRLAAGASGLLIPELQVRVDSQSRILLGIRSKETPGQLVVSECMILANHCASRFFAERRVPALYRCQARPAAGPVLSENAPSLVQLLNLRKSYNPVEISTAPGPHSGLGLPTYTSVTSPLRKYLDLVMQQQLLSCLGGSGPAYTEAELKGIAEAVQPALARAARVEQERKRYWVLKALQERIGESVPAVVVKKKFRRVRILMTDLLLEAGLTSLGNRSLSPGDKITVTVEKVDPFEGVLQVTLAG